MLGLPNARRCQHERVSGVAHDHGDPLVTASPDSRTCSIGVDGSDAVPCIAQAEGGDGAEAEEAGAEYICGIAVEVDDTTGLATACAPLRVGGSLSETHPPFWS